MAIGLRSGGSIPALVQGFRLVVVQRFGAAAGGKGMSVPDIANILFAKSAALVAIPGPLHLHTLTPDVRAELSWQFQSVPKEPMRVHCRSMPYER